MTNGKDNYVAIFDSYPPSLSRYWVAQNKASTPKYTTMQSICCRCDSKTWVSNRVEILTYIHTHTHTPILSLYLPMKTSDAWGSTNLLFQILLHQKSNILPFTGRVMYKTKYWFSYLLYTPINTTHDLPSLGRGGIISLSHTHTHTHTT